MHRNGFSGVTCLFVCYHPLMLNHVSFIQNKNKFYFIKLVSYLKAYPIAVLVIRVNLHFSSNHQKAIHVCRLDNILARIEDKKRRKERRNNEKRPERKEGGKGKEC